jgi:hypothetical protein
MRSIQTTVLLSSSHSLWMRASGAVVVHGHQEAVHADVARDELNREAH